MNFTEAENKRAQLSAQLQRGQITPERYTVAINALRVTDSSGFVWQPDPGGGGWIVWNGSAWQPGTPPGFGQAGIPAPVQTGTVSPEQVKNFNEFKSSLMSVDEFRKTSKNVPLAKRPQKWWDLLSILGGIVAAIIWFIYGGIRSGREGFDFITPLLMIAIPIILVWFRPNIDKLLLPLQPYRKKVSRIILIGLGIAIPFLTAWLLYNIFHISQYPLMQANIVVGTLAAYAITRDPQIAPGRQAGRGFIAGSAMIIITIMLCSMLIAPVLADDCASDPLNAQDCLRTSGYAEVMAGLVATILSMLVNGPIILQALIGGGISPGAGTTPPTEIPPQDVPSTKTPPPPTTKPVNEGEKVIDWDAIDNTLKNLDNLTEEAQKKIDQAKKESLLNEQLQDMMEASYWDDFGDDMQWWEDKLWWVEKTADISIDIGATLSPVGGGTIKNIYGFTKTIGKNISISNANDKGIPMGFFKGLLEYGADKILEYGTNEFTDYTKGKIPGFGNYGSQSGDYGNKSISDIIGMKSSGPPQLNTNTLYDDLDKTRDFIDINKATTNAAKSASQGQGIGLFWDPIKKWLGISSEVPEVEKKS